MAATARVAHAVPGRLRLRVTGGTTNDRSDALASLDVLEKQPGVHVDSDERTGSALLRYDPEELDVDTLVELVRGAHVAFDSLAPPSVADVVDSSISDVSVTIQRRFKLVDQRVLRATGGTFDLRVLVPIGLAGLSLRQLARDGVEIKSMPWYVLAWYSFDSFIKLHAGRQVTTSGDVVDGTPPAPSS